MTRSLCRVRGTFLTGGLATVLALVTACGGQSATVDPEPDGDVDPGSAGSVSIAMVPGWDEGVAATYLWKELLEERGYDIEVREMDIDSAFSAVADGEADLFLDTWLPTTHESYWNELSEDLETIGTWYIPATINLTVPEYLTHVNSVADLREHADEFDNRILGIEEGSGLMRVTREEVMPAYGLDGFELTEGSSAAMLAELERAVDAEESIVVPLWEPHWVYLWLPLKALEDPEGAFGEPDQIDVVARGGFAADEPDVARWLGRFTLSFDDLGSLLLLIQERGEGNEEEAVEAWMSSNRELADSWIR